MVKTFLAVIFCLSFTAPVFAAAVAQPTAVTAATKPAKPDWSELTPVQRGILAPLKEDWSGLDSVRCKKWVGIADRYPKMKPAEQNLLQARMQHWARLSPEQRRVAREKYTSIKKLPVAKREEVKAQWQQYQQSLAAKTEPSGQEPAGNVNPQ